MSNNERVNLATNPFAIRRPPPDRPQVEHGVHSKAVPSPDTEAVIIAMIAECVIDDLKLLLANSDKVPYGEWERSHVCSYVAPTLLIAAAIAGNGSRERELSVCQREIRRALNRLQKVVIEFAGKADCDAHCEIRAAIDCVRLAREAAWRTIEHMYSGWLLGYIERIVPRNVAEDIVQETFIRVLINLAKYDPNLRFRSWIFTIGIRLALNAKQKAYRERQRALPVGIEDDVLDPLNQFAAATEAPDKICEREEEFARLRAEIEQWPDDLREAVKMHYYMGIAWTDIAQRQAMNFKTLKVRIHRKWRSLREALEKPTPGATAEADEGTTKNRANSEGAVGKQPGPRTVHARPVSEPGSLGVVDPGQSPERPLQNPNRNVGSKAGSKGLVPRSDTC